MALVLQMPNCTSDPSGSTGEIGYVHTYVHVCVCRCVSVAVIDGDVAVCRYAVYVKSKYSAKGAYECVVLLPLPLAVRRFSCSWPMASLRSRPVWTAWWSGS